MSARLQTAALAAFQCTGDRCPDTCCQGWGMQVDRATVERYEQSAPQLRADVVSGEAEFVMRRNDAGFCVRLEDGWCSIHRDRGDNFIGDACHFYPRAPRALGETMVVSGALSCPEMVRLSLTQPDPFRWTEFGDARSPYILNNYLPEGVSVDNALSIHAQLVALAGDETVAVEHSLMRISSIARSLELQPSVQWAELLPFYTELADGRIPAAESNPNDALNLVHALHGLIEAATIACRPRLAAVRARLADALGLTFAGMQLQTQPDSQLRAAQLREAAQAEWLQPIMRRYLQAQLSQSLFPFAGFGTSLSERITIIGVRFATVKLALATLQSRDMTDVIDVIQPLSRFLDHLADPTMSLAMYRETGWVREARLRSLVSNT